jgi:hypothetical protein
MPWQRVEISKNRGDDQINARLNRQGHVLEGLLSELGTKVVQHQRDGDMRVYHRSDGHADVLWLSPTAAELVSDRLKLFLSKQSDEEPSLDGFELVRFPVDKTALTQGHLHWLNGWYCLLLA